MMGENTSAAMHKEDIQVSGNWSWTIQQDIRGQESVFTGKVRLWMDGNRVKGRAVIEDIVWGANTAKAAAYIRAGKAYMQFDGDVQSNNYYRFLYENPTEVDQWGCIILKQIDNDYMDGRFLGYGPESEGLANGVIRLKRSEETEQNAGSDSAAKSRF